MNLRKRPTKNVRDVFLQRLASGLDRAAVTTRSRWATRYRVIKGRPWSFDYHPWLKGIHDTESVFNCAQKGAQLGVTEAAMNIAFYALDVERRSVLYLLPSQTPDASDFSSTRFDPALDESEHLTNLFSSTKNVGVKQAGTNFLYIRGTRSRAHIKSIPVGFIIVDEIDEHDQDNLTLVDERMSGQVEKFRLDLSTPTIADMGINKVFKDSTQDHFFFKSPYVDKYMELTHDNLVITCDDPTNPEVLNSYVKCPFTNRKIEHEVKLEQQRNTGKWVSGYTNRITRGFYINQLYSYTITPGELAKKYLLGLKNPADEQEYFNSKMGLPHVVNGAQLTDEDINKCLSTTPCRTSRPANAQIMTMGVDVGKEIHVWIDRWYITGAVGADINAAATAATVNVFTVTTFGELDKAMIQYGIDSCVIDQNPEAREADAFAKRFPGRVSTCTFSRGTHGRQVDSKRKFAIQVDRTYWLDAALGRIRADKAIYLPGNLPQEARDHLKQPAKIYGKDGDNNIGAKYVSAKADHYAFARTYSEIALARYGSPQINENYTE